MGIADEIEKLNNLRQTGAISEDEYQKAKESLLQKGPSAGERFGKAVDNISSDVNMWSMFLHLSQFCGYIVPLAGLIVPIVLWQMKKDESEIIDLHGRIVVNWIITEFILAIAFALLSMILIGIPLLLALAALGIVFPIIGAVKANSGQVWPYPLSIRFFRLD
ncbi:MAG: DUF4870 domain-containing protein [Phycisphaerales bacterium]|nr:MAG: DUF4870 domain-containing protein [Phycisphaerales bacterium]